MSIFTVLYLSFHFLSVLYPVQCTVSNIPLCQQHTPQREEESSDLGDR